MALASTSNRNDDNVDDLISSLSTFNLQTLKNAAQLSPFSKGRTLGPDKEEYNDERILITVKNHLCHQDYINISVDNDLFSEKENRAQNSVNRNRSASRSVKKVECPPTPPNSNRRVQILDYDTVNSSVIVKTAEKDRQAEVRKQMSRKMEQFRTEDKKRQQNYRNCRKEIENWIQTKNESDSKLIREADALAQQALLEHNRELEEIRKENDKLLQRIFFDAIANYQAEFKVKYERVAKMLIAIDKEKLTDFQHFNLTLKSSIELFEHLIEKIKSQQVGTDEVKTAEKLCTGMADLEMKLKQEIEQISQQEEEALRNEQLKAAQNVQIPAPEPQIVEQVQPTPVTTAVVSAAVQPTISAPPVQQQVEPLPPPKDHSISAFVNTERLEFYNNILAYYTEKVERVKQLQNDVNMKKYRFACQKAINIPVNAISAATPQHLQDKFDKLFLFMSGNVINTSEGQPLSVNDHPLGRDYCLLLMAKKFVSQGDTAVSSNPQAAFPISKIIVSLWNHIPEFGQLFLAYLFKESPFLVPYFIPQHRSQPIEEYYKILGYRITDGVLEQQDMYLKRQSGIARLYFAVMITTGRKADGLRHPYGIENAWQWICNIIGLDPLPDICATLILEFLSIAGPGLWPLYGRQFVKLLLTIKMEYFPKLSIVDEGGPKARLEVMLTKILTDGQIPSPAGQIPINFW